MSYLQPFASASCRFNAAMISKIVFSAVLLAVAAATPYRDCGSTATISSFVVPGCTTLPCTILRGQNYTLQFDFVANAPANSFDPYVTGTFLGITAPWPGTFPPGCSDATTGDCPLTVGERIVYQPVLAIDRTWPQVSATAHWESRDENGSKIICLEVPMRLV